MNLGSYELLDEIGRGGMGTVHRARHLPTGALRAVKVLSGSVDPESLERFRREAAALAKLDGAGVVPVHESGVAGGTIWFAMDLVEGGSLRDRARRGVSWQEALRVVAAVARTLARCHALGLVHRDVKPENVLFDAEGRPRLADFGCVRDAGARSLTETGTVLGTPAYMPPEQLAGEPVGPPADVYALGVVLYELLTGRLPHEGKNLLALHAAAAAEKHAPPSELGKSPRELDGIVLRALAAKPGARPLAPAFARELEQLLEEGVEGAGAARRSAAALAAVVAAVGLVAAAAASRSASPAAAVDARKPVASVASGAPRSAGGPSIDFAPLSSAAFDVIGHLLRDRRYAAAIERCRDGDRDPPFGARRALLADCLLDAGDFEAALRLTEGWPAGAPGEGRALAVRAYMEAKRGEVAEAARDAARARDLDPGCGRAWSAACLALLGPPWKVTPNPDLAAVQPLADRAVARGVPGLPAAKNLRVRATVSMSGWQADVDPECLFEGPSTLLGYEPPKSVAEASLMYRMRLGHSKGEEAQVVALADEAVALNPYRAAPRAIRGHALVVLGRTDEGLASIAEALARDSWNYDGLYYRASALEWVRRFPEALEAADAVVQHYPLSDSYDYRGRFELAVGEVDRAIADFGKSHEARPDNWLPLAHVAEAYLRKGRTDLALQAALDSIRSAGLRVEPWAVRARVAVALGDLDQALVIAERAHSNASGRDEVALFARAHVRLARKEWREAKRDAQDGLQDAPRDPEGWLLLGTAKRALGEDARADLERFVELAAPGDPDLPRIQKELAERPATPR